MSSIVEVVVNNRAIDPSRSIALRNAFARAMRARFATFNRTLTEVIASDNVFGIAVNRKPGQGAFAFPSATDKVNAFVQWMEQQIVNDILQVTNSEQASNSVDATWLNFYVQEAYKKGIMRARTQMSVIEMDSPQGEIAANARPRRKRKVPPISQTGGIAASLATPAHLERLSMLYSRTFSELKGVTNAMSQLITRVLSEGIINGDSPTTIARKLNKVITGAGMNLGVTDSLGRYIPSQVRAEMIARTEIIRAHAEAQLTEFQAWKVEGVKAFAEILTTKDQRTCSRCSRLEKEVMTIDEARGVLPVHPRCRCIWLPYIKR